MSLQNILKTGQQYMQLCPKDKQLISTFREIKIIQLTQLASRFVPPLVILLFVWQYLLHANLAVTIITALFALSLPLQGYYWLGKRAQTPLPLTLLGTFNQLVHKLQAEQLISQQPRQPNYLELMQLLNLNQQHYGDYFSGLTEDDPDEQF